VATEKTGKKGESKPPACKCPFCEGEVECGPSPMCQPCGVTLTYCKSCNAAVAKTAKTCPKCGTSLK